MIGDRLARLAKLGVLPALVSALTRHGSLTWEMAKRDVLGRYRGASLGLFWSLLAPFLMLLVYTLAFGGILKARWPEADGSTAGFALILFMGLIVHGFFAECLIRSTNLVVSNPNYVKRIIFPLEILPWPMVLSALFHVGMNVSVFVVWHWAMYGALPWTIFLLPLVLVPLVVLALGLSWVLASLSVYFRDVGQITAPLATALLFLSSAIIPLDSVPADYRVLFEANPLTFIIDQARAVALWGVVPDWSGLLRYAMASAIVAYLGCAWFQGTRKGFADVL